MILVPPISMLMCGKCVSIVVVSVVTEVLLVTL